MGGKGREVGLIWKYSPFLFEGLLLRESYLYSLLEWIHSFRSNHHFWKFSDTRKNSEKNCLWIPFWSRSNLSFHDFNHWDWKNHSSNRWVFVIGHLQRLEHRWPIYWGWFELVFESLKKFSDSSRKQIFRDSLGYFFLYFIMNMYVVCTH